LGNGLKLWIPVIAVALFSISIVSPSFSVERPPSGPVPMPYPVTTKIIPDWVDNIFVWYGQGLVSEDDVLNAITFLVANQIIQIDMANQSMGMMGQGMMMQNMPFNVDAPVIMPLIDGYYNRDKVYFVHTEVSDFVMAEMMTRMINFPTLHVPELKNIPEEQMAKVYVFTNGIPGSEPYGGGPFMFQIDVFDSIPGQVEYSQFRVPHLVTWDENAKPRVLTSESDILKAETNGEITIEKTANVVNAPMVTWEMQGGYGKTMGKTSMVPRIFESMQVEGELTFVDEDNYIAIFKLHSQNDMGMMNTKSQAGPVTDHISLIDSLRANGATVTTAGRIEQPFFHPTGFFIKVNEQSVQVFEYNSPEDAEMEASFVSEDGSSVGTNMPLWVGDPHFYQKERIIVLYVGDDPAIEELLESVLGSQFAGR